MSMQFIETGFEVKAVEEDGSFSGYAGVFGNVDSHRDILMKGCTAASIRKSKGKIPILDHHDSWGGQIGWNNTAKEDDVGILVGGLLNLKVQRAVETHALVKQAMDIGAPYGLSIGYISEEYSIDEKEHIRKLEVIDLKEYSFVTFPSNTRANVLSIKSIAKELGEFDIKGNPKAIERIWREVGFSVSESKQLTTSAMKIAGVKLDDASLRDVDENEAKDVLESLRLMNTGLDLAQINAS